MKPANTKKYVNPNVNIFNMFKNNKIIAIKTAVEIFWLSIILSIILVLLILNPYWIVVHDCPVLNQHSATLIWNLMISFACAVLEGEGAIPKISDTSSGCKAIQALAWIQVFFYIFYMLFALCKLCIQIFPECGYRSHYVRRLRFSVSSVSPESSVSSVSSESSVSSVS